MELFGRRDIYTAVDVNETNIVSEVNKALSIHCQNMMEEEYLYWYRRGLQPVLNRDKQIRPEIKNCVVENHADEIVSFKNGYFLTQPAFYVARNEESTDKVKDLNEFLYRSGKQDADNELVNWFHTVGKAVLYVEPSKDMKNPVNCYALDPRSAFVVRSMGVGNKPAYAVNLVVDGDMAKIDVITPSKMFRLLGQVKAQTVSETPRFLITAHKIEKIENNPLGLINIIEYTYNSVNMGAFESVVPLLDAINTVASNRVDGIEQFIQSLLIFYNCQLGKDDNGNDITPDYVRKSGALFLQNIGENKADLKEISSQLNQSETQVLVDYMYQQVLTICGMPTTTKGGASTSDTGTAVLARDGWYQADTVARNTEDLFRKSNRYFDEVFLKILKITYNLDLDVNDFTLEFVRNETANIQAKAQAYTTLISGGFHPILAMQKSGVSNDPMSDYEMSKEYINKVIGMNEQPEEVEEDAEV